MTLQTTYTDARARLAELLDRAGEDLETIIITRRGAPDVALVSADELRGLQEIAHLFRSPANARRLLEAMERSERGEGLVMDMDDLLRRVGLSPGQGAPRERPARQAGRSSTRPRTIRRSARTGRFEPETMAAFPPEPE